MKWLSPEPTPGNKSYVTCNGEPEVLSKKAQLFPILIEKYCVFSVNVQGLEQPLSLVCVPVENEVPARAFIWAASVAGLLLARAKTSAVVELVPLGLK